MKTVNTIPPLSAQDQADLHTLAAQPDSAIDYSDIPPLTATQGERGRFYTRMAITVHLDADIVAWLKATQGYEDRLNAMLRDVMHLANP